MLTVAIVGFGLSGRYLQAPFFLTNPNFRLKTIVSNNQNPTAVYPSVQKATSLDAVLADKDIDLVSISSPNNTHFDYAQRCLLAGKHILVEKPFTATAKQAETLIALAKKRKKHVFVFQNRRFDSDFLTVKHIVDNHLLGELISFEAHFNRFKPLLNPKKWKEIADPSNGILYDLGAHITDQVVALFGRPLSISGETFTQREHSEVDDAFDIRLDYGRLKVTLKSSLLVREDSPRYILQGTKGSFIKHGVDIQEDQLKAGLMPTAPNFGAEPVENQGLINAEINGLGIRGKVDTMVGAWHLLFQNIHDVIVLDKEPLIKMSEVLEQIKILEKVKQG
jgi:scyllo-inositol 2-dehydrogenase (NADP+)